MDTFLTLYNVPYHLLYVMIQDILQRILCHVMIYDFLRVTCKSHFLNRFGTEIGNNSVLYEMSIKPELYEKTLWRVYIVFRLWTGNDVPWRKWLQFEGFTFVWLFNLISFNLKGQLYNGCVNVTLMISMYINQSSCCNTH